MENDSNSIVKQSLVLTAKLVGVFALWVTVLSFVVVTLTGRAVNALAGPSDPGASATSAASSKDSSGAQRENPKTAPAANAAKSNG